MAENSKGGMSYRWGRSQQNIRSGPAKPQNITEYPKWVNGRIAQNADEEAEFLKQAPPVPPPAPVVTPKAKPGENPLAPLLNAAYARNATLEAEIGKRDQVIAHLQGQLAAVNAITERVQENENALGDELEAQETEQEPAPGKIEPETDPAKIEIPENWAEAHHRTRMSLARQITGQQPTSAEDADATIRAEVARRASQ